MAQQEPLHPFHHLTRHIVMFFPKAINDVVSSCHSLKWEADILRYDGSSPAVGHKTLEAERAALRAELTATKLALEESRKRRAQDAIAAAAAVCIHVCVCGLEAGP
jgi:hypothetical protein